MDHALVPLGHTPPRALDLQQLRAELSSLWREEGKGVSRACHATLVVVVAPGEEPDVLLEDLVLTHPSRVLRIQRDPKVPSQDVVAWATGCCMKRSAGMLVCSETLHFMTGDGADARLPSIVRSLAVGGVPLVVICQETSPLRLGWVQELGDDVDVIVGRSGGLDLAEAQELWHQSVEHERSPRVEDVSWDELQPWRAAIQGRFDRAREVTRLSALSHVTLELGKRPGAPLAWLLAGWLGSRLAWRRQERLNPNQIRVERTGGHTTIEVRPGLVADTVTFAFEDGKAPVTWTAKELPAERQSAPLSRTLHRHAFSTVAMAARKMALKLTQGQ